MMTIPLSNYATFFDPTKTHHRAWLQAVLDRLIELDPKALDEGSELRDLWKAAVETKAPSPTPNAQQSVKLTVPWFSQNDNSSGTGYRECFSSSAAILSAYWGKVAGDDAYNLIRSRYGDTTDPQAQLRALRSLGLVADFRTDGTPELLRQELNAGRPVAVGWLHKGLATAPSGGGHWSVVVGYRSSPNAWLVNDPNGEADLVNGGYTKNFNGSCLQYSTFNWNPRWMVRGTGGWMLTCRKP
jgi:hypothetical protein